MPPTLAAARKTYSGFSRSKNPATAWRSVRSSSRRVRQRRLRYPAAWRVRTRAEPTRPRCPATKIRLSSRMGRACEGVAGFEEEFFALGEFEVVLDHAAHQVLEGKFGLPAERLAGTGGVAVEVVDFGGAEVAGVLFDERAP